MSLRWRLQALTVTLIFVEVASFWKLSHWLFWTNEPWLAYTTALALIALLLSAIIAMGSEIPPAMRRHLHLGGIWLFLVQGLANVLIAYQHSFTALPVEVVTGFFNVPPDVALKAMAILQGATLSIVSISFWNVLGQLLRTSWQERQKRRQELQHLEQIFQEVSRE